jgi:hypothetical protein
VLLGIALALAEECVLQQTSLAPLVGSDPAHPYGRALGVNWIYLLWAIVYECVWVVVIPIQLAELIFADRRHELWLQRQGIVLASVVFVLASFVAWFLWTQIFVPRFFPDLVYHVPLPSLAIALAVIGVFILAALATGRGALTGAQREPLRPPPSVLFVGLIALLFALPWFLLVFLAYGADPTLPFLVPLVLGMVWALRALIRFHTWSTRFVWDDNHRLAAVTGALLGSMLAGYPILVASKAPLIDVIGKIIFNAIAIVLLGVLARRPAKSDLVRT